MITRNSSPKTAFSRCTLIYKMPSSFPNLTSLKLKNGLKVFNQFSLPVTCWKSRSLSRFWTNLALTCFKIQTFVQLDLNPLSWLSFLLLVTLPNRTVFSVESGSSLFDAFSSHKKVGFLHVWPLCHYWGQQIWKPTESRTKSRYRRLLTVKVKQTCNTCWDQKDGWSREMDMESERERDRQQTVCARVRQEVNGQL